MCPIISDKPIALIGYSGHAYVVKEIFDSMGFGVTAYCEQHPVLRNPYNLTYLGNEREQAVLEQLKSYAYFVAIGDNGLRAKITQSLKAALGDPAVAVHTSAIISTTARLSAGVMVGPRAVVNAQAVIEEGVICNTGSIIEHECQVAAFAHIAPGAVLCGGVSVGKQTLIGANAVIRPGVRIGSCVRIGAGAVIVKDVADGQTVIGNNHRLL